MFTLFDINASTNVTRVTIWNNYVLQFLRNISLFRLVNVYVVERYLAFSSGHRSGLIPQSYKSFFIFRLSTFI